MAQSGEVEQFDLVVIGSGPAGEKGAVQAAYFGKKVAMVERAPSVGGASVHTGTLPSKTLREAALYVTGFQRRELYGMTLDVDREASLRRLMGRLHAVINQQVDQITHNLRRHDVQLYRGQAELTGPHEIAVRGADESQAPRRLSAEVILVATGSSPHRPPGVPFEDSDVEDSDTILDLDRIPTSLAVVGGGVIGCEYASIFAAIVPSSIAWKSHRGRAWRRLCRRRAGAARHAPSSSSVTASPPDRRSSNR